MVLHRGMVRRERLRANGAETVREVRPGVKLLAEKDEGTSPSGSSRSGSGSPPGRWTADGSG
nr:hypothetical protein GCM10020093_089640 [Planobispora longispora]